MWPSHLFCRLLTVSIISLSVWTICSISSFVLCSVHGTYSTWLLYSLYCFWFLFRVRRRWKMDLWMMVSLQLTVRMRRRRKLSRLHESRHFHLALLGDWLPSCYSYLLLSHCHKVVIALSFWLLWNTVTKLTSLIILAHSDPALNASLGR